MDERLAHQFRGIFYLRIEDTDDKRFVEGAVDTIFARSTASGFPDLNWADLRKTLMRIEESLVLML